MSLEEGKTGQGYCRESIEGPSARQTIRFRLVGGGEKGEIKLWNFNNGQCIQVLDKGM